MRTRFSPTLERTTLSVFLGAMVGLVLWRELPFLGPTPEAGLYNSDSAIPVLMSNLATGAPVDWLFWGQDRFGSWPFLLSRAARALTGLDWTPHRCHVVRTLWRVAALVPWLGLAGRGGLVAAAGLLLLPGLNPLLDRVLVDLGTVDGWQLPALLWAWWGLRRAAGALRPAPWLALAAVAGALATWTSLVSAPVLLALALVEGWGRRPGLVRPASLVLPAVVGVLVESLIRTRWHRAIRTRGWRDVRTPASLDVGHLLENARNVAGLAWREDAVPWLAVLLAAAVVVLVQRRRGVDSPERRTVLGAAAAAAVALVVVVSVRHVRDNDYASRYIGVGSSLAVLGCSVLLGAMLHGLAPRLVPRASGVVLAAVAVLGTVLLAPVARPDPREVSLRPGAREIANRFPGAVLALSYWRSYAIAALLPPGVVVPVPREGEWNRRPDWAAELRSGRPVLVGWPEAPGGASPRTLVERGASLMLVAPDVLHLPPDPGQSTGERVSLYRAAPAER